MNFHYWHDFIRMGGYGIYIWSAFGMAAMVLILNYLIPLQRQRRLLTSLRKLNDSLT